MGMPAMLFPQLQTLPWSSLRVGTLRTGASVLMCGGGARTLPTTEAEVPWGCGEDEL